MTESLFAPRLRRLPHQKQGPDPIIGDRCEAVISLAQAARSWKPTSRRPTFRDDFDQVAPHPDDIDDILED